MSDMGAVLPIVVALLGLSSSGGASIEGGPTPGPVTPHKLGKDAALLAAWLDELNVPIPLRTFVMAVASKESHFNRLVALGLYAPAGVSIPVKDPNVRANETKAAQKAYERNLEWISQCPWPASAYTFGSGGLFGLLPANAFAQLRSAGLQCSDPGKLFQVGPSLVMFLRFLAGLQNWKRYQALPTWLNLRVGVGNPSLMADPERLAKVRPKFAEHLEKVGMTPAGAEQFMNAEPPAIVIDVGKAWAFVHEHAPAEE